MNKWVCFGAGIITGLLTIFVSHTITSKNDNASDNGFTYFEQPGDNFNATSFEVFQALTEGFALARALGGDFEDMLIKPECLLYQEGKYFYDDEIVKVPTGKVARQIGIYRYKTKSETDKTVPIVEIMK